MKITQACKILLVLEDLCSGSNIVVDTTDTDSRAPDPSGCCRCQLDTDTPCCGWCHWDSRNRQDMCNLTNQRLRRSCCHRNILQNIQIGSLLSTVEGLMSTASRSDCSTPSNRSAFLATSTINIYLANTRCILAAQGWVGRCRLDSDEDPQFLPHSNDPVGTSVPWGCPYSDPRDSRSLQNIVLWVLEEKPKHVHTSRMTLKPKHVVPHKCYKRW